MTLKNALQYLPWIYLSNMAAMAMTFATPGSAMAWPEKANMQEYLLWGLARVGYNENY